MEKTGAIPYEHAWIRSRADDKQEHNALMNPAARQKARILGRGPLGFSRKTWPFVKVLVANWIFSLAFYVTAKFIFTWSPLSWTVADRLELMIKCSIFSVLPAIAAIAIVAAQRLNPDMWVGQKVKPNSALDVNTRFILNTLEQFILFLIGLAGIAMYAPHTEAHSIPVLTALFLLGRMLFWVGYHKNPYLRAFGFGVTFYPTVGVFFWLLVRLLTGYTIPI